MTNENATPRTDLSAALDELYSDRALVVLLAVTCAADSGLPVHRLIDDKEPDWPVLAIQLPTGQVSWHIDPVDLAGLAPIERLPLGTWDGHTTAEKMERIRAFVRGDDLLDSTLEEPS